MAAGDKPALKVQLVSKADKSRRVGLLAAWPSQAGGFTGKFDKSIVAIKLADGTVIKPDAVYVNVYDNHDEGPPKQASAIKPSDEPPPDFGEDDTPF